MALLQSSVTLNSSSSVNLTPVTSTYFTKFSLIIQNNDASAIVYLGNSSSVTSSAYGLKLAAGSSVAFDDIAPGTENIWAISSASSTVQVLTVAR
jgi:hypothetical protein